MEETNSTDDHVLVKDFKTGSHQLSEQSSVHQTDLIALDSYPCKEANSKPAKQCL